MPFGVGFAREQVDVLERHGGLGLYRPASRGFAGAGPASEWFKVGLMSGAGLPGCSGERARLRGATPGQASLSAAQRAKPGGLYWTRTSDPFHVKEVL